MTETGPSLEGDLGEKVTISWLTSPCFELREKFKCIEHCFELREKFKCIEHCFELREKFKCLEHCFELREKFKCIEHIGKSKIWTKTSP